MDLHRFEAAKRRKTMMLDTIRKLDLPNNPLDDIIDQLGGPDCVAEMTGRRGMLIRATNGKGVVYQARNTKDVTLEMINMHEKQQFMDGKKNVAVISEAASAGVSLQADRRVLNQVPLFFNYFPCVWYPLRLLEGMIFLISLMRAFPDFCLLEFFDNV
jgi:hypothetical protein